MTTDNQGAIFIYDFPGQCIREKVMMDKPDFQDYDLKKGGWAKQLLEYNDHLASLRTFSYPVSKEQYDHAINEIGQLQEQLKEAEDYIKELQKPEY